MAAVVLEVGASLAAEATDKAKKEYKEQILFPRTADFKLDLSP
jgi:hypothetical protein